MGAETAISWCDATFNPWWGCTKIPMRGGSGCDHCYAATLAGRWGHDVWGKTAERRTFGDKHWAEPLKWNREAEAEGIPKLVFCASMADVFEDHHELPSQRDRLWALIDETPWLRWLLLTKRPENVTLMVPWGDDWPHNVWLGTTVESRRTAVERIPWLETIPARLKFLSCEPLLESLGPRLNLLRLLVDVDWLICGGESGAGHRSLDAQWVRDLRDAATFLEIPFHLKQWGGRTAKAGGKELDGREWCERPDGLLVAS